MGSPLLLREAFAAAQHPQFRILWLANSLASSALFFDMAVLTWLAFTLTGSPWQVALVGFWRTIPLLAIGALGGVLADLFDRRRVAIATQWANAAVALGLAALLLNSQIAFWHLAASSLLMGLISAADQPTRRALVMDLVGRRDVVNAVALDTAASMASRIPGPLLGGALIALVGLGGCYLALALCYAAAGLAALGLRPVPPLGHRSARHATADLAEGFRYALRRPAIWAALAITMLCNLLVLPYQQFLPVFARDTLALDPFRYGTLWAITWLGAFVASTALAGMAQRFRPGPTFLIGPLLIGFGLLPFALTSSYLVAILSLFVVGAGQGVYTSLQATILLLRTDEAMRGRMMGLLVFMIGVWPLGMLVMGSLIELAGASAAVVATSIALLLALGALTAWRRELYQSEERPVAGQRSPS